MELKTNILCIPTICKTFSNMIFAFVYRELFLFQMENDNGDDVSDLLIAWGMNSDVVQKFKGIYNCLLI